MVKVGDKVKILKVDLNDICSYDYPAFINSIGKVGKVIEVNPAAGIDVMFVEGEDYLSYSKGEYICLGKNSITKGDTVRIKKGWLKGCKGIATHVGSKRIEVTLIQPRKGCKLAVLSLKLVEVSTV